MRLGVLVAAAGAPWESALLRGFEHGQLGVTVTRRCVDVVELLSVAAAGHGRAVLLDARLPRLDAHAVDRLRAVDVVPVGIIESDDAEAANRMRAMGVEVLVGIGADPRVVAGVLHEAVSHPTQAAGGGARAWAGITVDPPEPAGPAPDDTASRSRSGSVLAVWGPAGAPGRTTVATSLADEISRLGAATLLIDADVYGGTVAPVLGLLDESPGFAAACRAAGERRLDGRSLAAFAWQVSPLLRVLTGIPLAQRWPELRAAGVTAVLDAAREVADWTVVDCAFALETDEELSFDSIAPRRNGATLAALDAADAVVAVGACDPIGMQRLVRGLTELREAEISAPVHIVVNKTRRICGPGDPRDEVAAVLHRFEGCEQFASLPYDREALDAAIAVGRLLSEARPASPLRQAVVALARSLTGIESRSERRRRRR